jgi:hypothetical protein
VGDDTKATSPTIDVVQLPRFVSVFAMVATV